MMQGVVILKTDGGDLPLVGSELVSEQIVKMVQAQVESVSGIGATSIVLSNRLEIMQDSYKVNGIFCGHSGAIVISLKNIADNAIKFITTGEGTDFSHYPMNFSHLCVLLLIRVIYHEVHHSITWKDQGTPYGWSADIPEETAATTFADKQSINFAKMNTPYTIEPAKDMDYFGRRCIELYKSLGNETWASTQRELIDGGMCWMDKDNEVYLTTLRSYYHAMSDDKHDCNWARYAHEKDRVNSVVEPKPVQEIIRDLTAEELEEQEMFGEAEVPKVKVRKNVDIPKVLDELIRRVHQHVYNNCGPDGKGGFTNLSGVNKPIMFSEGVGIIQSYGAEVNGRFNKTIPFTGTLIGNSTYGGHRPQYKFSIKLSSGKVIERIMTTPIPNKDKETLRGWQKMSFIEPKVGWKKVSVSKPNENGIKLITRDK